MPIARIITHSVAEVTPVVERLHALGYRVETVAPGEPCEHPADLEISVEKQKREAVLNRAAELLAPDTDIYIAAGVFPPAGAETNRVVRAHYRATGALVPNATDTVSGVAAGLQNKRDLLARALRERRAALRNARLEAQRRNEPLTVAASTVPESFTPPPASLAKSSTAPDHAEQAEWQPALEPYAIEAVAPPIVPVHEAPMQDQPVHEEVEVAGPPPGPVQDAPMQLEHVEHEEVGPVFAEAGLNATRVSEPDVQPITAEQVTPSVPSRVPPAQLPPQGHRRLGVRGRRKTTRRIGRAREWRAAIVVSSVFSILLMVAWSRVTKGPLSPLPGSFSQSNVEEQVPFGSVTIKPTSAPLEVSAKSIAQKDQLTAPPAATKVIAPVAKPSPNVAKSADAQVKGRAAKPKRRARPSDDSIAEDVIVRHFKPQSTERPKETQKASLKRYSDLK